ncbi:MAG: ribosomal protein S18-alanine N-acetyltransferase [Syntrophomonadaceae bacterium]|nr:ribosomal protein S18-alanine N-acetyltransferase [Syntrophomonadaceae bacterium]
MLQPNYVIRKMTELDLDEIIVIEHQVFTLPWSIESYRADLRNEFATYLVCDVAGEVAAYGGMWNVFEEAHITNIAVNPNYRRLGLGKTIMLELEKAAKEKNAIRMVLEVRPSNSIALNLYEGLGYIPTSFREKYYSDNGEDALVMTKLVF